MPETKRPLKVFLCHAHSDAPAVRALYNRLVKDGVDTWLDKEKLLPGADWEYEIRKAVRESDVVVVCHSKQFNQKGFRQKEVRIALEEADLLPKGEIFIIPARLEECDVLEDLIRWHWVDLFEADGYDNLMRALQARANKVGATLQIHKSWLPGITSPRSKIKESVEEKVVASNRDSSEETANKEKVEREAAEKTAQEKAQRELDKLVKKNERRYKREIFWIDVKGKFDLFLIDLHYRLALLRINFVPIMLLLAMIAIAGVLVFYLYVNIPILIRNQSPTLQPSQLPAEAIATSGAFTAIPTFNSLSFNETLTFNEMHPSMTSTPMGIEIYTVQVGDTLYEIALKFHTTVEAIEKQNNLSYPYLRVGQILQIPVNGVNSLTAIPTSTPMPK